MARESYASAVARHVEIMYELFTAICDASLTDREVRGITRAFIASVTEVERLTALRLEASDHEYQRREGKKLAELARTVAPRG